MKTEAYQWSVRGPFIKTNPKGEYDGELWTVARKSPTGGKSAHEWVLNQHGLVKLFRSEKEAKGRANTLNPEPLKQ